MQFSNISFSAITDGGIYAQLGKINGIVIASNNQDLTPDLPDGLSFFDFSQTTTDVNTFGWTTLQSLGLQVNPSMNAETMFYSLVSGELMVPASSTQPLESLCGVFYQVANGGGGSISGVIRGGEFFVDSYGTGNVAIQQALLGQVGWEGVGSTCTENIALYLESGCDAFSHGSVITAAAVKMIVSSEAGDGTQTITNGYGLWFWNAAPAGLTAGVVSHMHAIHIDSFGPSSVNPDFWGIYEDNSLGTTRNRLGTLALTGATPTVSDGQLGLGVTTATSANAGSHGDVPAQVAGYLEMNISGTMYKVPYYAV